MGIGVYYADMETLATDRMIGMRAPFDEPASIAAAQKGDAEAFGKLVREYQRRAYAAAYELVRNRDDALDLAQESFARAFRAMNRFDTRMPFYPWLYRIIRNTCLNHLKKKRRHGETSLEGLMDSGYDARDRGMTPSRQAEQDDIRRAIQGAMAHLSPEHQEILRLRHFLEMSYGEIAVVLGIPAGTVMSRLHMARQSLRKIIEQEDILLPDSSSGPVSATHTMANCP